MHWKSLVGKRITDKIENLVGEFTFHITKTYAISPLTEVESDVVIQQGCIVSRNVILKKGSFINARIIIGHDVKINEVPASKF